MKYVVLAVFLMLFIAGCSTGTTTTTDDNAKVAMKAKVGDTTSDADQATSDNLEAQAKDKNPAPLDENTDAFSEFKSLMMGSPEYHVKYEYSINGETSIMEQWITADKLRTDTISEGVESRTFMVGTSVTSCTKDNAEWTCLELKDMMENGVDTGIDDIKSDPDAYASRIANAGTRTVAGELATCFKVAEDVVDYTYCYSKEGIPLLIEWASGSDYWSMTALEFSRSVSDADFEPPVKPQDLSSMLPEGVKMPDY